MQDNRRKKPRVPVAVEVALAVADGEPESAQLMNVSESGFFMKTTQRPGNDAPVRIVFVLKPDHVLCEARGRVVWQGDFGLGVDLDTTSDAYVSFMKELEVAALSPQRKRAHLERILAPPDVEIG